MTIMSSYGSSLASDLGPFVVRPLAQHNTLIAYGIPSNTLTPIGGLGFNNISSFALAMDFETAKNVLLSVTMTTATKILINQVGYTV